ncbi:MAG: hypothetical protein QM758_22135 [Armatimonas sp.]
MSRYLEIPVSGPLERIAERAHLAFRSIGRVQQYTPTSHITGTIRCNGVNVDFRVSWKEANESFLLDLKADTAERLYAVADRALYEFARAYKAVIEEERELAAQAEEGQDPWYRRLWPLKRG